MDKEGFGKSGSLFSLYNSQEFIPSDEYIKTLRLARKLLEHGAINEAFEFFEMAIEQTRPDIESQAKVYYERAEAHRKLQMLQEALDDLLEARSRIIAGRDNLPNGVLAGKIEKRITQLSAEDSLGKELSESTGEQTSPA